MDAFTKGIEDFEAGLELDNNPYDESDSRHDEWDDGWAEAKNRYQSTSI